MTSLPINIWGSRGGRSRGREGTVIRVGKSQEWDWGVRTSIRKRKTQTYSSAGFLTVMSEGHWRSLLREIPAPQWVTLRKKMNLTLLDSLEWAERDQFKSNISKKAFCERLQYWSCIPVVVLCLGSVWLKEMSLCWNPWSVSMDLLAFLVQSWNILES